MPTVEKVSGPRIYVRRVGAEFSAGDRAEVSESGARYLVEERGDFEIVDAGDEEADGTDGDVEICGAELNDGGTCDRPADECPYHGDEEADGTDGDTED